MDEGGILRTHDALERGIHPRTLYQLRDKGLLEQVSRGVFRLASLPPLSHPDLVAVAMRVPRGVICLTSALSLHELTTQIPHEVHLALPRGTKTPVLVHPPLRVFRFSGAALTEGIETRKLDGVDVRLYSPEKSVVDCFRFRNKLGTEMAVEALKLYLERPGTNPAQILELARLCRMERVMLPYLEALA
jgi:predicted transcriptional regulator of viral defense system